MSIQEFAKHLSITLDDLMQKKQDCITNVILKSLQPLALTERPFHCTNVQDKSWHVKDADDGWEEDNGNKIVKNVEHGIQQKWTNEFETSYPNWINNSQEKDAFVKIAGMTSMEMPKKDESKLLKDIGSEVYMKM